ncbi:lysozyme c-1 [Harpegnathos saltator]|uniref:lysozyme n=1 Tax=Harpegnathos saltator TaxID=610380 RepID=E2C9U2_HARSA|nr:lysozyme c-1 [Harpegnathos saltator]EFN75279.1 Lysozyme c-1 [Harpegnathos saltator]
MGRLWVILLVSIVALSQLPAEGKILAQCDVVREMMRAKVSRSFISNWICLMQSESGLDTSKVTGPKGASSYSFGILQINSATWCTRGRAGGLCNKRCEDFINDDIQDDIACALKIYNREGFKAWDGWVKKCKNKPLPNIGNCRRRRMAAQVETL